MSGLEVNPVRSTTVLATMIKHGYLRPRHTVKLNKRFLFLHFNQPYFNRAVLNLDSPTFMDNSVWGSIIGLAFYRQGWRVGNLITVTGVK